MKKNKISRKIKSANKKLKKLAKSFKAITECMLMAQRVIFDAEKAAIIARKFNPGGKVYKQCNDNVVVNNNDGEIVLPISEFKKNNLESFKERIEEFTNETKTPKL